MADINSSEQIIPNPAVSSLSGNIRSYESAAVVPIKGGKRKGSKGRRTNKATKATKATKGKRSKTLKKCWWKLF
jgi:hypothetical protein